MSVIDDYLQNVPPAQKSELERIRQIVKQTVPGAEETISYGMPAFKLNKKPLIYFGDFKDHISIFPTPGPLEALSDRLGKLRTGKGTVQYTLDDPIAESLVVEIINRRLESISKK